MSEERYLRINSCTLCPYTGHSGSAHNRTVTFFCCNPIHSELDKPREKMGDNYYPITHITEDYKDNPIPEWCELPSKCSDKRVR